MTVRLAVVLPVPPEEARGYLRDPRHRPAWQSSLRRVEDVRGDGGVGTTWRDVTRAGIRPAMRVTEDAPGRWAETGDWRGWRADLVLELAAVPGGTRVGAVADVVPPNRLALLRRPVEALAARGIAADLRRVRRLLADLPG